MTPRREARRRLGSAFAVVVAVGGPSLPSLGASLVVFDGSLGAAGAAPTVPIPSGTEHRIEHTRGRLNGSGSTLFHSLSDLSIDAGDRATFSGPASIDNVFTRVTGGNVSDIQGELKSTIDSANLYLLNPAGVIFGPSSKIDVQGSFHVSTADTLRFPAGEVFEARFGGAVPMLAVDPPTSFGFLDDAAAPGIIRIDRAELLVPIGETFGAIAEGVEIVGRNAPLGTPTVKAPGGRVELAAAGPGIEVPTDVRDFDARSFAPGALGDVTLDQSPRLQVSSELGVGSGTGTIAIRGGNFVMKGGALASIALNATDGATTAIDIAVADRIALSDNARLESVSIEATSGDIALAARRIDVDTGALIASVTAGTAIGPQVHLDALALDIGTASQLLTIGYAGEGGLLSIETGDLTVTRGGVIASRNHGAGAGGAISVTASGSVDVGLDAQDDVSLGQITTLAETTATGGGGSLEISAQTLRVATPDGSPQVSQVSALTQSSSTSGTGGALAVRAATIDLMPGGQLRTTTEGAAAAGASRRGRATRCGSTESFRPGVPSRERPPASSRARRRALPVPALSWSRARG